MIVGRFSFTGILPVSHGSLIFVFFGRLQFLWQTTFSWQESVFFFHFT
jgi:hypothetical protein